MGYTMIHKKEMQLNKNNLENIINKKGMNFADLHREIEDKYGLNLTYKGFMSVLSNRVTWKLLYAHAIVDVLNINYMDIFEIIEINREEKLKEKEKWKEDYGKQPRE